MTIEVYSTRWANLLKKLFIGKGSGGQLLSVLDDIMPMVGLIDPSEVEHHYTREEQVFAGACQIAAAVGTFTAATLYNKPGSNRLVVIERVTVSGATAACAAYGQINASNQAGNVPMYVPDLRWANQTALIFPPVPNSVELFQQNNLGAAGTGWSHVGYCSALGVIEELVTKESAVVLAPGWCFVAGLNAANAGADFAFYGYSRPIDQGE